MVAFWKHGRLIKVHGPRIGPSEGPAEFLDVCGGNFTTYRLLLRVSDLRWDDCVVHGDAGAAGG